AHHHDVVGDTSRPLPTRDPARPALRRRTRRARTWTPPPRRGARDRRPIAKDSPARTTPGSCALAADDLSARRSPRPHAEPHENSRRDRAQVAFNEVLSLSVRSGTRSSRYHRSSGSASPYTTSWFSAPASLRSSSSDARA